MQGGGSRAPVYLRIGRGRTKRYIEGELAKACSLVSERHLPYQEAISQLLGHDKGKAGIV